MNGSMLDLAPREQSARGAGSNTETFPGWTAPAAGYTAAGHALTRAGQPGYFDWLDHVRAAGGCTQPIRLSGTLDTIEDRFSDVRHQACCGPVAGRDRGGDP